MLLSSKSNTREAYKKQLIDYPQLMQKLAQQQVVMLGEYLFSITNGGPAWMKDKSAASPEFDRFVPARQVWDRAFACNIAAALQKREAGLIIGIIGKGHLEFGHGTPFQLRDLGIENSLCFSLAIELWMRHKQCKTMLRQYTIC